jgi:hypothetical protein
MGRRARARRAEQAEGYAALIGLTRVAWGAAQVLAPGLVGRFLLRPTAGRATPAWRMKGARDLLLGIAAVAADDRRALATWTWVGALVDVGDTLATGLDRGRVLRPTVTVLGTLVGVATAAAAGAATDALRRAA